MVRLKSRVGPLGVTFRRKLDTGQIVKERVEWNIDNSVTASLPESIWEELREQYLDKRLKLKYKEALIER